ncbi:MAG: hypothetical protein GJ680_18750 [Alteromonadaceae bacterium]|nr:hypothetical protein [Alteromonadaceae bacterium]
MSNIITRLYTKLIAPKRLEIKDVREPSEVSVWRDTGEVYYLENTLKLSYQSNSGAITLEKVHLNNLADVLQQIDSIAPDSPLARVDVANQASAFNISLCAVTWQKKDGSVRIKAIPDAALLRSKTSCFSKSQAVFRHAFLLEHDDLLSPTLSHTKEGVFTYNRVSIAQFTQQIQQANAKLANVYKKAISVKHDNFTNAFTDHENQIINDILVPENVQLGLDK